MVRRSFISSILIALAFTPWASAQEPAPPSPAEQLQTAEQLQAQEQWDQAIAVLREVVARRAEEEGSAATAQLRIGECYLSSDRPTLAIVELEQVPTLFPLQSEAADESSVRLIDALDVAGRGDEAMSLAQSLATNVQLAVVWQGEAMCRLARLLGMRDRIAEGLSILDQMDALELPSEALGTRLNGRLARGDLLMAAQRQHEAMPVLEEVISRAADSYPKQRNWARVRLAEALTDKVVWDRAVRVADEVIADHTAGLAPDEYAVRALLWKGRALERWEAFEAALEPLQMAVALAGDRFPEFAADAEHVAGDACRRRGELAKRQGEGWGRWRLQAMDHYAAALAIAQNAQLSSKRQDHHRHAVGGEMGYVGMWQKAVATLRVGIEDPANLVDRDDRLAERIGAILPGEEAKAWQEYLADPVNKPDPTAGYVLAEFGEAPSAPSSEIVHQQFRRQYWLGRLQQEQRQYTEAKSIYEAALGVAATGMDQAEALAGIAFCERRLKGKKAGRAAAKLAADAWLEVMNAAESAGDAHHAIDMMILSYKQSAYNKELIQALENTVATISPESQPSRACFARVRLMQEYIAQNRKTDAEAVGQEALTLFLDHPFSGSHEWLCSQLVYYVAHLRAQRGDKAGALALLDQLEQRYPDQCGDQIAFYRSLYQ